MAKGLNKCMFIGYLGADPETRYTASGAAVTNLRIAVSREWKTSDGAKRTETDWVNIVAWNQLAEICNQYLHKGSRVYVEGRLENREWEDGEGNKRYKTEINLSDMIMLDGRNERSNAADLDDEDAPPPAKAKPTPTGARPRPGQPQTMSRNRAEEITDDDIPF
jgi:single-strand DNA-binding protein